MIEELALKLSGKPITPSDENYNETRKVYNGMIDKHPGLFVMCVDVADVMAAVNFGRDNNLFIAVRGGGHHGGELGICDDVLVIDLSDIKFVRIDTTNNTVRVGGGNLWGEVDHANYPEDRKDDVTQGLEAFVNARLWIESKYGNLEQFLNFYLCN